MLQFHWQREETYLVIQTEAESQVEWAHCICPSWRNTNYVVYSYCLVIVGEELLFTFLFVYEKGQFENIKTWPILGLSKMKIFLSTGHHEKFYDWSIFNEVVYSENGITGLWIVEEQSYHHESANYIPCFQVTRVSCNIWKKVSEEMIAEPCLFAVKMNPTLKPTTTVGIVFTKWDFLIEQFW